MPPPEVVTLSLKIFWKSPTKKGLKIASLHPFFPQRGDKRRQVIPLYDYRLMARKARKFIHITGKSGFLFPLVPVAQADLDIAHNYRKIVQTYSVYNQQKKKSK